MISITLQKYWEETLQTPRYADEKRLLRYGQKAYSQNDEDGILTEIFRRVGTESKTFIEIGIGTGLENNTLALLASGWRGLWMDGDHASIEAARRSLAVPLQKGQLQIEEQFVTRDNINRFLQVNSPVKTPDLLSIDIDGNDYWVWKAIEAVIPRVVVIEYNATWYPPLSLVVSYQESFRWDGSNYYGASLKALESLGAEKGYRLVGCCFSGANAFFVRDELCGSNFRSPFTADNHYEPPRYWMYRMSGFRPGFGAIEVISDPAPTTLEEDKADQQQGAVA